jgi:hypothetical protein
MGLNRESNMSGFGRESDLLGSRESGFGRESGFNLIESNSSGFGVESPLDYSNHRKSLSLIVG